MCNWAKIITFLQATFANLLVVLRHFWQYVEFKDRSSKKPVSVTKTDMILQLRIWLQEFAGTNKPCKWLALTLSYNISESQKRRYITLNLILLRCHSNIGIACLFSLFFDGVLSLWAYLCLDMQQGDRDLCTKTTKTVIGAQNERVKWGVTLNIILHVCYVRVICLS